jgi:hypothetical protein
MPPIAQVTLVQQPVPEQEAGGSGLLYASGSHRDVALPYWYSEAGMVRVLRFSAH